MEPKPTGHHHYSRDINGFGLLPCKLPLKPHFADRKRLMQSNHRGRRPKPWAGKCDGVIFIKVIGGGAVAWPLVPSAQQRLTKVPRIGIIDNAPIWDHFRQGLSELVMSRGAI